MAKRDEICSNTYNSLQEAKNAAQSAGFNLSYAGVGIGANDAHSSGQSKIEISSSDFCKASAEAFQSSYASSYASQIADAALRAWSDCVDKNSNRMYVQFTPSRDGQYFAGDIIRTATVGPLQATITRLAVTGPGARSLDCSIGGRKVTPGADLNMAITTSRTALLCQKSDSGGLMLSIQTTGDSIGPIDMPSKAALEVARYDSLQNQLTPIVPTVKKLDGAALVIGEIRAFAVGDSDAAQITRLMAAGWVPADGRALTRVLSV